MPDYSKAKIYTIRNRTDNTLIYVGSTVEKLSARFSKHKTDSRISISNLFSILILNQTGMNGT